MRLLFYIVLIPLGVLGSPNLVSTPPNGNVLLQWTYDTNQLDTNTWFNIYETTNISIPLTNWNCLTNVVGTNLSAAVSVEPGFHAFVATTSNFWGETSITSNITETPALPQPINNSLKISKSP